MCLVIRWQMGVVLFFLLYNSTVKWLVLKYLCRSHYCMHYIYSDLICDVQVMRHGVGLSTSSDSELITQLLALTPPMEELDAPDWVAR